MAEEVCLMLNSMGEAELKMLTSHFGGDEADHHHRSGSAQSDHSALLEGGSDVGLLGLSQSNLMDVDDINDGDLLSVDIANMSGILNDLNTPTSRPSLASSSSSCVGKSMAAAANLSELFGTVDYLPGVVVEGGFQSLEEVPTTSVAPAVPDHTRKGPRGGGSETATTFTRTPPVTFVVENTVPELTTVNMYWNDLPGLMLNGYEHVRLVDIHKQIMPAKVSSHPSPPLLLSVFINDCL